MNCLLWPLKQLLCLQELTELKAIKHRYHVWKDYLERDNERIVDWNVRAKEVCERKICSRMVATKQGVPKEFWFKPYNGKFNGEKFVKKYAQKRHTFQFATLDTCE